MSKIALIHDGVTSWNDTLPFREASRGIIIQNGVCFMVHSTFYDDYIFPGGGIEANETKEEALQREVLEEVGFYITDATYIGYIDEVRGSLIHLQKVFQQRSHFFLCKGHANQKPRLEAYELAYGFKGVWVDPALALKHNYKINQTRKNNQFLMREILMLEKVLAGKLFD